MPEAMGAGKEFFGSLFAPSSGPDCNNQHSMSDCNKGGTYCQWNPAGPGQFGGTCSWTPTPWGPACGGTQFGCCPDESAKPHAGYGACCKHGGKCGGPPGPSPALGPDCNNQHSMSDCNKGGTYCQWNPAGPGQFGGTCSWTKTPWEPACGGTQFGCCPDGSAKPHAGYGACCKHGGKCGGPPPAPWGPACGGTQYGCCADGSTNLGYGCCPDGSAKLIGGKCSGFDCNDSQFGCCPDGSVKPNAGYGACCGHGGHCGGPPPAPWGPACGGTQYGCCADGSTNLGYGCCPDGSAKLIGGKCSGFDCNDSQFGCCPDGSVKPNAGYGACCGHGGHCGGPPGPRPGGNCERNAEQAMKNVLSQYRTCMQTAQHPVT